jgi:hypothetical protein
MIIEGDAGLGKTRLLVAARETARALEFRIGLGTAEPGHGSVLMEALFSGTDPLIDRTSLGSRDRSHEEPFWLLADIQTLMERAALQQPLLVCLDDVQWADAGCGFALRMLTQWLASLPVAWLIGKGAVMNATLDVMAAGKEDKPEPTARQKLAEELVARAREQGVSLTGPDGLLAAVAVAGTVCTAGAAVLQRQQP